MRRTEWLVLAGLVGLCLAVGIAGSGATAGNVRGWYLSLHSPPATPPNWLFGPVWAMLYTMMAVAAWLVWREPEAPGRRGALRLWGWQLLLNAVWAPLFFGLHLMLTALVVLVVLFAAVVLTIARFGRLNGWAALLLVPYLFWVGFAAYLNAGFYWLNS